MIGIQQIEARPDRPQLVHRIFGEADLAVPIGVGLGEDRNRLRKRRRAGCHARWASQRGATGAPSHGVVRILCPAMAAAGRTRRA